MSSCDSHCACHWDHSSRQGQRSYSHWDPPPSRQSCRGPSDREISFATNSPPERNERRERRHHFERRIETPHSVEEPPHERDAAQRTLTRREKEKHKHKVPPEEHSTSKRPKQDENDHSGDTLPKLSRKEKASLTMVAKLKMKEWTRSLEEIWDFWHPSTEAWDNFKKLVDPETLPKIGVDAREALEKAIEAVNNPIWTNDLDMALGVIVILEHETFEMIFEKFAVVLNAWVRSPSQRNQAIRKGQLNERMRMSQLFEKGRRGPKKDKPSSEQPCSDENLEEEVSQGEKQAETETWQDESRSADDETHEEVAQDERQEEAETWHDDSIDSPTMELSPRIEVPVNQITSVHAEMNTSPVGGGASEARLSNMQPLALPLSQPKSKIATTQVVEST